MQITDVMRLSWVPSAFQIRLGGSKGVVAIDPNLTDHDCVYVRESMQKYESSYRTVEVLEQSRPSTLKLNQQVGHCIPVESTQQLLHFLFCH